MTFTNPNVTNCVVNVFSLSGVDTTQSPVFAGNGGIGSGLTGTATLSTSAAASVQQAAYAVLVDTINSGDPFTFSASSNGLPSGTATVLSSTGESGDKIFSSVATISGLSPGTNAFMGTTTANQNVNNMLAVAVFEPAPAASVAASYSWTGAASGSWSLSSTDINWSASSGPAAYSDSSVVTFSDSASTANVTIAAGGVQPASVTFSNNRVFYSIAGGAISGPATVTLSGSGGVRFSSANTYTGSTAINAGTLHLADANALQESTAVVNVADGLSFAPGPGTFNLGGLSGSGSLALSDTSGGAIALQVVQKRRIDPILGGAGRQWQLDQSWCRHAHSRRQRQLQRRDVCRCRHAGSDEFRRLALQNELDGGRGRHAGLRSALAAAAVEGSSAATPPADAVAVVPEPGTIGLLLAALWSAAIYRRFRRPKAYVVRKFCSAV